MITLGEDGLAKVKSGITTPEELLRVVTEVREMRTLCAQLRLPRSASTSSPVRSAASALGGGCPHCGRALQPGWNFCPYCATQHDEAEARRRSGCAIANGREGAARAAGRQRRGVQEVGGR